MQVFFVHERWQSYQKQRLAALSTSLLCVSLAFIAGVLLLLRIAAAFLCRMTFVFQSRFASPDSWSKIDAPALMACLKNSRKGCVMLYKGGLTLRKIETLKLTLLVCRPFLGRWFEGEKANNANNNTLNNRGLLISDEKEKECEEVVCPITQHCVRGVCVCLPGKFC